MSAIKERSVSWMVVVIKYLGEMLPEAPKCLAQTLPASEKCPEVRDGLIFNFGLHCKSDIAVIKS